MRPAQSRSMASSSAGVTEHPPLTSALARLTSTRSFAASDDTSWHSRMSNARSLRLGLCGRGAPRASAEGAPIRGFSPTRRSAHARTERRQIDARGTPTRFIITPHPARFGARSDCGRAVARDALTSATTDDHFRDSWALGRSLGLGRLLADRAPVMLKSAKGNTI